MMDTGWAWDGHGSTWDRHGADMGLKRDQYMMEMGSTGDRHGNDTQVTWG